MRIKKSVLSNHAADSHADETRHGVKSAAPHDMLWQKVCPAEVMIVFRRAVPTAIGVKAASQETEVSPMTSKLLRRSSDDADPRHALLASNK
jgi:hypothetical protein